MTPSFVHPSGRLHRPLRRNRAFTLIELLTVMAVILILAGIVIGTSRYAGTKAARSRAEGEIAALAAACENYKLDNGDYPAYRTQPGAQGPTDALDPVADFVPGDAPSFNGKYVAAGRVLYQLLTGRDPSNPASINAKFYFTFKANMLAKDGAGAVNPVTTFPTDAFGYPFGYSTSRNFDVAGGSPTTRGYNPTFDLWSTAGFKNMDPVSGDPAGDTRAKKSNRVWIKNW